MKYIRFITLFIPLGFCLLALFYRDSSYLIFAGITTLFAILVALPKFSIDKKISFFHYKEQKEAANNKWNLPSKETLLSSFNISDSLMFFLLALLLFISVFTYSAVHSLPIVPGIKNSIIEYYVSQFINLKQICIVLLISLLLIIFLGNIFRIEEKTHNIKLQFKPQIKAKRLLLGFLALLVAFIISFISTYIYGLVQLNISTLELNFMPKTINMIYGKDNINNKLKSMSSLPQVVGIDNNTSNLILTAVTNGSFSESSYYKNRVINAIPKSLIIPFTIPKQSVFMVGNLLVINTIDKDVMQTITPALAKLLLANYFQNRNLKGDPTITILNRQEYLTYRQDEINKQVAQIESVIQKVNSYLNAMESDASATRAKISSDQNIVNNAQSKEGSAYNDCISIGYMDYYTGNYYNTYSQSYCSSLSGQWAQVVAQGQQNISQLNGQLQYDQGQINEAQNAIQMLQGNEQSVNSQKDSTPDELGLFEGPSHVRIVLDSTSPKAVDDFLETLVHENLHYQSYVSQDRIFQFGDGSYDGFWEEGLTEYFARKVISTDLGASTNQGYPLIVKLVAQIAKKIPETELQKIYFTKNESLLESDLNAAYGQNFYKDSELYFETLSYLPDNQQLKVANNIMSRIHGKPLSQSDLYSSDLPTE